MQDIVGQCLRFLLKLLLGVFALLFAVSLITAAVIALAWTLLKALITGKKPTQFMAFGRFKRFSPPGTERMWPGASAPSVKSADVVDVEAREIRDEKKLR